MPSSQSRLPSDIYYLVSAPHYPLGHVLLQNADAFRRMGIVDPLAQRLGAGAFGTAYQTSLRGASVIKLTRDVLEAQAAYLLRGRESSRIVQVYDAWAVPGTFTNGLRGWYAVHRELLQPLSPKDSEAVEVIFQLYNDDVIDLSFPRNRRQHGSIHRWRSHIQGYVFSERRGGEVSDEGDIVVTNGGQLVKRTVQMLLQIGAAVDEMHRAGIDWEDVHPGNMMRTAAGRLVIGDVGYGVLHDEFSRSFPKLTPERAEEYAAKQAPPPDASAEG